MTAADVDVGGHRLHCEEAGSGPAVLLLHAGGADSSIWDSVWEELTRSWRVIRFDFPGAGESPYPEKPFSVIGLIDGLLDALDVSYAAVVGVSLGGGMAIDYVLERPQRVWALGVVASGPRGITDIAPDPREEELWKAVTSGDMERAARLFVEFWSPLETDPQVDERIRTMVARNIGMLRILPEDLIVLPEWSAAERLGEIAVPTLVVWGDRDLEEMAIVGNRTADGVPGARRVVLPGVDHFVPMRAPGPFLDTLTPFLEEARPS